MPSRFELHRAVKIWARRAHAYDNQGWVRDRDFLDFFIKHCSLKDSLVVLDVGCGTGAISRELAPLVARVVAIDISPDMLAVASASGGVKKNLKYIHGDAQRLPFDEGTFDLVTMRMSLHHIENTARALSECYRVLKNGGRLVLCEGVPPDEKTRRLYEEIFALKEKRHTFSPTDLNSALARAGFSNIKLKDYLMRQVSLVNWLKNSAVDKNFAEKILALHLEADKHFKDVYQLKSSDHDVFINWKFALVSGEKRRFSPLMFSEEQAIFKGFSSSRKLYLKNQSPPRGRFGSFTPALKDGAF